MIKICCLKRPQVIIPNNGLLAVSNKMSYWKNSEVLDIYLFPDCRHKQEEIELVYTNWLKNTSLKFNFVTSLNKSDIRIDYKPGHGSWSYVGTDALMIKKNEPTMNIGWDGLDVIYHEVGHSLGLLHEHQNPAVTIKWDKSKVIKELSGPPNRWNLSTINNNVLNAVNPSTVNYTSFDPHSVMLYFFPDHWTLDGKGTKENPRPSEQDLKHIQELYPAPANQLNNLFEFIMQFPDLIKLNREQLIYMSDALGGPESHINMSKRDLIDYIKGI